MIKLKSIQLKDFRSYPSQNFEFNKKVTIFIGPNAIGKTNIIEAITLLSIGRSFKTNKDEEMIAFGSDFARVSGDIGSDSLEVVLTKGIWQGKKVAKKRYLVNGSAKRRKDFMGNLRVVLFEPENLNLIIGSPSVKRDYFDFLLSQVDRNYDLCLLAYQKGIRQRNRLLQFIRDGKAKVNQLEFWNRLLLKNGEIIRQKRQDYVDFLNQFLENEKKENMPIFQINYLPNVISPSRLESHLSAEIASGNTLIGPSRDNFTIIEKLGNRDIADFGSRGQQRLAVFALKLSEMAYIENQLEEKPLLLLDDIFSELDNSNQHLVMDIIENQQSILTTTSLADIGHKLTDFTIIEL